MLKLQKGFIRWHVYVLGHTMGDEVWIAKFRLKEHAEIFIERMTGVTPR